MNNDLELRQQLVALLTVRQAHMDFVDAVAEFPEEHINTRPPNCAYTFWHLVEHLRLAQKDILDYVVDENYQWPNFPDDFWPDPAAETDRVGWEASIAGFLADREAFVTLINDPENDLFAPLPNSGDYQHNLLREVNVLASHNAYHTGELGILRQTMNLWPEERN